MAGISNAQRALSPWILAPIATAILLPFAIVAVPRAGLVDAVAAHAQAIELVAEREQLVHELESFEGAGGFPRLEDALRHANALIPTECPALFAAAAVEISLERAGIRGASVEIGDVAHFDGDALGTLLGRRIDVRGRALPVAIREWTRELELAAGPVAFLEANLAPGPDSWAVSVADVDFRIAALLVHCPKD